LERVFHSGPDLLDSRPMTDGARLVTPAPLEVDEATVETSLRPRRLAEYIGQTAVKDNLRILLEAARAREEAADHILLYGPPGLGKTTLANIVARELGVNIHTTSGPAIERAGDLAAILTNLEERDVLFIDEIHRLNHSVEEILYPAMEDFGIDVMIGRGPSARSLRLSLKPFTVIGATTRAGRISSPLRDRFGAVYRLDYYAPDELATIIQRSAGILGVEIDPEAVAILARRGRGTPRVVNRLLRRVRDFAQVRSDGRIGVAEAEAAMTAMDIDDEGLDTTDRRLLAAIVQKFASGPVGGAAVAAVIGEEVDTVEDVYEPFLLQLGFLDRTPQGRMATERAREHLRNLGYDVPPPRRSDRVDPGLWDGVTVEGRTESEMPA
ncbi:MAG: holliday junction helicase RuvB, partial [Chloroflexota bacterium]|nr:holliday junction helicase RuvB [Chloroflexota bacterium]